MARDRPRWRAREFALFLFLLFAPLILAPGTMVAVNLWENPSGVLIRAQIPSEPYRSEFCTWSCHNAGCRHTPVLKGPFTGRGGLFDGTIAVLKQANRLGRHGYGAANLLLFCVFWPGLMLALYAAAVAQRITLWRRSAPWR